MKWYIVILYFLLGNNIVFNSSESLNTPNRGVKTSKNFYVLKHTKIPALLIEIDFVSNISVKSVCLSNISTLLTFVNKKIY